MAKGTMSIECNDEGLGIRTRLEDVSMLDKMAIVSSRIWGDGGLQLKL